MVSLSVDSVVFVRFPFSDLSGSKKRPALVLAELPKGDLILCQITSKAYADPDAVELHEKDFVEGKLTQLSYIRPGKIFTANLSIVDACVAKVHPGIRQKTVSQIERLLRGRS